MVLVAPTNIYVSANCDDIESANEIHHRNDIATEINDDGNHGESSKTNNLGEIIFAFEADGMQNLGDEENQHANLGGIIDSQDDVGTKCN